MAFFENFVIFSQIPGGTMLKFCIIILLLPLSAFAEKNCEFWSSGDSAYIECLQKKLTKQTSSRPSKVGEVPSGGEVPWPIVDSEDKGDDKDKENEASKKE